MNRHWFKPRRYGIGVTPSSWEGWLATVACVVLMILDTYVVPRLVRDPQQGLGLAMLGLVAVLGGFIWLAQARTDGDWRWRWGEDDR